MKTITIEGKSYKYNEIKEINDFLKASNIVVTNHVQLGDNISLEKDIVLETAVKIGNNSKIGCNVRIGTDSKIGQNVSIGNNVVILTCGDIGNNCIIEDGITIGEENTVHPDTHLKYSKHIKGSVATVTYTGNHRICIGCVDYSIDYWKEHSKEIGEKWKYTPTQVMEYEGYITLIEEFLKTLN